MKITTSIFILFLSINLFGQNVFTPELLFNLKRLNSAKISPDGSKFLLEIRSYSISENKGNTDLFIYDIKKGKSVQITDTKFSEMESCWGTNNVIWFLSTEKNGVQLWKMDSKGENKKQVSNLTDLDIEGFKLSPDEKKILFIAATKMGTTAKDKHPDLPLANARIENDLMYRHWNTWSDDSKKIISNAS